MRELCFLVINVEHDTAEEALFEELKQVSRGRDFSARDVDENRPRT